MWLVGMLACRSGVSAVAVEALMDNVREEGKLELTEVLRSYAGGAANWAPHRAERGPYTGRGASTVGLFAVTGPAGLVCQSLH